MGEYPDMYPETPCSVCGAGPHEPCVEKDGRPLGPDANDLGTPMPPEGWGSIHAARFGGRVKVGQPTDWRSPEGQREDDDDAR